MSHPIAKNRVIIVPVKIIGPLGEKFTQAILDTGATYTMFPPAVLLAVGYKPTTEQTVKIITASSVEYVPTLVIDALEFLGKRAEKIQVVSHGLPPGTPAQGLIGINALQSFRLEIDFPHQKLSLS